MDINVLLNMIKKDGAPLYFQDKNGEYSNLFDPSYGVCLKTGNACGAGACGACACACGACGRKYQHEQVLEV